MTSMARRCEQVQLFTRDVKEAKVHSIEGELDPRDADLRNVVHGWRGVERAVMMVISAGKPAESALAAVRAASVGFDCDMVALTVETYTPNTPTNPITGREWQPGEMQEVAEKHRGLEDGGPVHEMLLTYLVNRAGDVTFACQPYQITRQRDASGTGSYSIKWLDGNALTPSTHTIFGHVAREMQSIMQEPPLEVHMALDGVDPADFGLTPSEARAHLDCAMVKILNCLEDFEGAVVLQADPGSEREAILRKSLGEPSVS